MDYKQITFEEYLEMCEEYLPFHFEDFLEEEKENFCAMIGITDMDTYVIQINDIFIYFDKCAIESIAGCADIELYASNSRIASLTTEDLMFIDHFKEYMEKQFVFWKNSLSSEKKQYGVAEEP